VTEIPPHLVNLIEEKTEHVKEYNDAVEWGNYELAAIIAKSRGLPRELEVSAALKAYEDAMKFGAYESAARIARNHNLGKELERRAAEREFERVMRREEPSYNPLEAVEIAVEFLRDTEALKKALEELLKYTEEGENRKKLAAEYLTLLFRTLSKG
jgi:hypothetical protein